MLNLAGTARSWIRHVFENELLRAGIPIVEEPTQGVIDSPIRGMMVFANGQRIEFYRECRFIVVTCLKTFPEDEARKLNNSWRKEIRVEGFAGGNDVPKMGVGWWHVDTKEGLMALTTTLLNHYGPCAPQAHPTRQQSNDCTIVTSKMNLRYWKGILWGATMVNSSPRSPHMPVVKLDDGSFCFPYTADHARRLVADLRHIIDVRKIKEDFWCGPFANTTVADVEVAVKIDDFGMLCLSINCPQACKIFTGDYSSFPFQVGLKEWKRFKQSMHADLDEFEMEAFLR